MMSIFGTTVVLIPLAVVLLLVAVWIWSLIDIVKTPAEHWEASGQSQLVWILVVLIANLFGTLLYVAIARPKLQAVRAT